MAAPVKTRGGAPEAIRDLANRIDSRFGPWLLLFTPRIKAVTGADYELTRWWQKVYGILFWDVKGAHVLLSALHYAEMCADPFQRERKGLGILKNPGGHIACQVMAYARRNGITLPVNPLS